jgi:protein-L-isoaspartate(D-aspartate) O-methyltransferase
VGPGSVGGTPLDDTRYVGYRRKLIEDIRSHGISDLEILQLFDRVPRHVFLPEGVSPRAYEDAPIPIGYQQTASQPSLQAYYLTLLRPERSEKVLEIGTGSGYLTALLALMADRVYSVERVRELSQRARKALDLMTLKNVALLVGDGTIGWRKYAPFDVVVVSAASPSIPPALVDQLGEGGRMLIPVGARDSQELVLVRKDGFIVSEEVVKGECTFVPLLGRFAWKGEGS